MKPGAYSIRIVIVLALIFAMGAGSASAQSSGANPTAESVTQEQLMQELNRIQGRITIPDGKLSVLQQPQGREYRSFHEGTLLWIGSIAILGMIAALAAYYFIKGRIRMRPEDRTGRTVQRFGALERFTHWMTATSFIVLAITGLNYIFGKRLLMPLLGPEAFAAWSQWAKYAHNFISWAFMLGVLLMIVLWIRDNLPDRYDMPWLKAGGGFFGGPQPNAGRFNAGQKLIFWAVALGGIALAASGLILLFPFSVTDVNGMQWAQYIHATVGVLMIAVILAHIYIGTLGMEGAYEGMWSGEMDVGWARRHHGAWIANMHGDGKRKPDLGRGRASAPAE